jgi:hypothetical protein
MHLANGHTGSFSFCVLFALRPLSLFRFFALLSFCFAFFIAFSLCVLFALRSLSLFRFAFFSLCVLYRFFFAFFSLWVLYRFFVLRSFRFVSFITFSLRPFRCASSIAFSFCALFALRPLSLLFFRSRGWSAYVRAFFAVYLREVFAVFVFCPSDWLLLVSLYRKLFPMLLVRVLDADKPF